MIPARSLVSAEALRRYDDNGDPVYSPSERILLVLRWYDWISTSDLYERLELNDRDRGRHQKALERLIASGRVECREVRESYATYVATGRYVRLAAVRREPDPEPEPTVRLSRDERVRIGLCRRCDSMPVPGHKECAKHLEANRQAQRRRRAA